MHEPQWVRQALRTLAYLDTVRNHTPAQEEQRAFLLDVLRRTGYLPA